MTAQISRRAGPGHCDVSGSAARPRTVRPRLRRPGRTRWPISGRSQRPHSDGIRDFCLSRGLGDVYKRQCMPCGNTEVPSCSQARRASWVAAAGEPAALPGPPSAARPGDRRVRGIRSDYLDPLRIIGLLGWKPGRSGPGGNRSACRWKAVRSILPGDNQVRHCLAVPAVNCGRACRGSAWRLGSFGPVCEARTSTRCLRVSGWNPDHSWPGGCQHSATVLRPSPLAGVWGASRSRPQEERPADSARTRGLAPTIAPTGLP